MLKDFEFDVNGKEIQFKGNTNLKSVGTRLEFTKEHIEEYLKCAKDYKYFAEKYYSVVDVDKGVIKPVLRDYQIEMIDSYINNRFTAVLASRQCGKSTSFEIYTLWLSIFNSDKNIAILANKLEQSCEILMRIKNSYELLPKWLQQGVNIWNVKSVKLENGSRIVASATNSSSIRGKAVTNLIVDEAAFIKDWDNFISSVYPTIASGKKTKVIYVSTPNGLNFFYHDWQAAISGKSKFHPIKVGWERVPGRDQTWKEDTINNIGLVRFEQEFNLNFLGSVLTLVDPDILRNMKWEDPLINPIFYKSIIQEYKKHIRIFEEPKKGHIYAIGVDSCKMTEDNSGDALGMQVLDITKFPYRQVCVFFAESGFNYLQSPEIANKLGVYYNNAYMFVENNEIGQEVANMLHFDLEYENIYFENNNLPGFRTTKKTKRLGCENLKLLIENDKLVINDFNTISQMSTFVKKKTSYEAGKGSKDDLVSALLASLFFLIKKDLDIGQIEDAQGLLNIIKSDQQEIDTEEVPMFGILPDDDYDNINKVVDADGFSW